MLIQLAIRDFAIVDTLDLEFHSGMTAITGETGAGKSILLGALGLCLGERADAGGVRHGAERADLSARFDITERADARAWLAARELPVDDCLLRRVVTASGRSKAWINGQPATVTDLRELGEHLIDVHSQHAHQALLNEETHRRLLDDAAGHQAAVIQLAALYKEWHALRRQYRERSENDEERQAKRQLLRYQVEELDQLDLHADELAQLEQEQETLAHLEETLREAQFAADSCDHDEGGALTLLQQATQRLSKVPGSDRGGLSEALGMLNDAQIQIEEAARELHHFVESTEMDPQRLAWVEDRLGEIHRIARKHHVMPEELTELHQRLAADLAVLENGDDDLETLRGKLEELRQQYREAARKISETRQRTAKRFARQVQDQLAFLGMEKASFAVDVSPLENPQPHGLDRVSLQMSANPGQPARPLAKVASGGELSRVSLAIQVVAASHSTLATLVFDEVDVGISGATAEIVGQLLRRLGGQAQVMTVTHLPQVAAQAHQHLHIEKRSNDRATRTQMSQLDEAGRVRELARMLGGVKLSDRTLAHAREMLDASQSAAH
ncbi:DNA repair protein RecN [Salinicola rhizosphaerae]|uniref:DNA repair protein RecN n=1 Tax=Salinicola rhizosphaerae TaxID=1443141 RepID=A0ABQ3DQN7_9GAMM|nr:DNA repair protein RecN [Salinicola rhizosphaerae]GHB12225.1 DNA repair protein RecN [Salinicola rhizosphaerae]